MGSRFRDEGLGSSTGPGYEGNGAENKEVIFAPEYRRVMALLALRPGVGVSHAANGKGCLYKPGYNGCTFDANGNCSDTKCTGPLLCRYRMRAVEVQKRLLLTTRGRA